MSTSSGRPKIVVVGAGIAGAACAAALAEAGLDCTVLDRGRAPGGRMASPVLAGRPVDVGASYFTVSDEAFDAVAHRWLGLGAARQWTDTFDAFDASGPSVAKAGPVRWAAPGGLRSLVRDLLAERTVHTARTVRSIEHDGERWRVDGEPTDVVVLAMPDPQARRLLEFRPGHSAAAPDGHSAAAPDGHSAAAPEGHSAAAAAAAAVEYGPVIAVTAGWPTRAWRIADGIFVNDHPDLSFVADDGSRRGDGAAVLVAHSTATFAARHLQNPDAAVGPLVSAMRAVLDIGLEPAWTDAHRWTFAKPTGTHGDAAFFFAAGLGLAGDSWCPRGAPRVESAWLSGTRLGQAIAGSVC